MYQQCEIKLVLTSRHFLKRRPFDLSVELVYLEDLQKQAGWFDKLVAGLQAFLVPLFVLERVLGLDQTKRVRIHVSVRTSSI